MANREGTPGNDKVVGTDGNDELKGLGGNDKLYGGRGSDQLYGGPGNDVFVYDARGFGRDVIKDFAAGDKIDLSALHVSSFADLEPFITYGNGNAVITFGFGGADERITIENIDELSASMFVFDAATKGSTVSGVDVWADVLFGGKGADILRGNGGGDTIVAGAGNDKIIGGAGHDRLYGGAGNDVFVYDARGFGRDTIKDFTAGDKIDLTALNVSDVRDLAPFVTHANGNTTIKLGFGGADESITIENVDDLAASMFIFNASTKGLTVTGRDVWGDALFGGKGADVLRGNGGADVIVAGAGNDKIIGGSGNDTLYGGAGNDVFIHDARRFGRDTIKDFAAGDKIDLSGLHVSDLADLLPFVTYVNGNAVIELGFAGSDEKITIENVDALSAAMFIFDTSTKGLSLNGVDVWGDVLFGGKGADTLRGNGGHDTIVGGAGDDKIFGGTGNDVLLGGAGNDVMDGGLGKDVLRGGAGADTATYSTSAKAVTVDLAEKGKGGDAEGDTYDSIENIIGSRLSDKLIGNGANNVLEGGKGADELDGGAGNDTAAYTNSNAGVTIDLGAGLAKGGDADGDVLTSIENLTGSAFADKLIGTKGANILDGGKGADVLTGGLGNDTYLVDHAGDKVGEVANGGNDLVISSVSYALAAKQHVETLQFSSDVKTANLNLAGNELDNTLLGNAGANQLKGGAGVDKLIGGAGRDLLDPGNDSAADVIAFGAVSDSTGAGRDVVLGVHLNGEDRFDFAVVPDTLEAVGGTLRKASFDKDIAAVANAVFDPGGGVEAIVFTPTVGDLAQKGHVYLVIDANNDGSYAAGKDYVVELVDAVGTLDVSDFF